ARGLDIFCDLREPFGKRQQPVETDALDLEARIGLGTARILKHRRNEAIIAGRKILRGHGCSLNCRSIMARGQSSCHRVGRRAVRRRSRPPTPMAAWSL